MSAWDPKEARLIENLKDAAAERLWNSKFPDMADPDPGDFPAPRTAVLDEAKELISGDRNNHYGEPTQDFTRTAGVLNALGYRGPDQRELQGHDTALIIAAVKMSRLMWTPGKRDSWVDLAGYAACGYECALEEEGQ